MSADSFFAQFCEIMNAYCSVTTHPCTLALGVSGGCDSLALTYWAHLWQKRYAPNVTLLPFIVDHGIRSASAREAQQVFDWLVDWGLEPRILTCTDVRPTQAHLRRARYQHLLLACHQYGAGHLLLGHHQDDVLETVWMRRQAGSHWRGLAGMSSIRQQWGVRLVRPLLGFAKQELREVLHSIDHPWIEDPSNHCETFQRTHARKFFAQCTQAQRSSIWRDTLEFAEQRYQESLELGQKIPMTACGAGYRIAMEAPCFDLPVEQGAWLLSQWLSSIVVTRTPLKAHILQATWKSLIAHRASKEAKVVFTLGGCIGLIYREHVYLFREWGRIHEVPYPQRGAPWCWDHRFFFSLEVRTIHAVGLRASHAYEDLIPQSLPPYAARWARAALPQSAGGKFFYAQEPCPIFHPIMDVGQK